MKNQQNPIKRWTIRSDIKAGDLGYLVYLHGMVYSDECGWDETFEAYVAKGLAEFVESFDPDYDRLWLAEMKGRIIGSIAIEKKSIKVAQLHWFFVHPDQRGYGLGKELISSALDFCKKCGFDNVYLWTTKELSAAAHLYNLFGFKKTEDMLHRIWGKDVVEQRYDLII